MINGVCPECGSQELFAFVAESPNGASLEACVSCGACGASGPEASGTSEQATLQAAVRASADWVVWPEGGRETRTAAGCLAQALAAAEREGRDVVLPQQEAQRVFSAMLAARQVVGEWMDAGFPMTEQHPDFTKTPDHARIFRDTAEPTFGPLRSLFRAMEPDSGRRLN